MGGNIPEDKGINTHPPINSLKLNNLGSPITNQKTENEFAFDIENEEFGNHIPVDNTNIITSRFKSPSIGGNSILREYEKALRTL